MTKTAPCSSPIRQHSGFTFALAAVGFDFVSGHVPATQLRLDDSQGSRLHARAIDGHAIQQIFGGRIASIGLDPTQIEEHFRLLSNH
jgi:hypothetical protein